MDVARLAGEPGAVGGTAPLDPCAPLGEGRLYWSAGPGAARSVCDQYVGEGLRAGRSSLPPQDAPIPEANLRPLYSPSTEGPPRDAAKHPQTSDSHDRRRSPFSSGLASTPPGREWERRSQDPAAERLSRPDAPGAPAGGEAGGWSRGPGAAESADGGRCRRGPQGALGRRKPGAPLSRPGSGRSARHPCAGGREGGAVIRPRRRQSFPVEQRPPFLPRSRAWGRPSGENCFRGQRGPPLQPDPAPPLRPTRIPNLGGAAGLRTRAFLSSSSSSHWRAGSGPSGRRDPHSAR